MSSGKKIKTFAQANDIHRWLGQDTILFKIIFTYYFSVEYIGIYTGVVVVHVPILVVSELNAEAYFTQKEILSFPAFFSRSDKVE